VGLVRVLLRDFGMLELSTFTVTLAAFLASIVWAIRQEPEA
jgi:hypothetical protein